MFDAIFIGIGIIAVLCVLCGTFKDPDKRRRQACRRIMDRNRQRMIDEADRRRKRHKRG